MPINPDAVGEKAEPVQHTWTSKDALLYALGIGAGAEDPHQELEFTTENTKGVPQRVFPTMAVVLSPYVSAFEKIGRFNPAMVVHGEQGITLHGEIPVSGTLVGIPEITAIFDKGNGAVVTVATKCALVESGEPLFDTRTSVFIRGEGGWGGDRGPSGASSAVPDRAPDHQVTYTTRIDQALLYRLSGDRNPLHSDPAFAARGGFDRPILHGLCTLGFTGRALLHALCDGDPRRITSVDARFSAPVMPGEPLTIRVWTGGTGEAVFETAATDGRVVITGGRCRYTE